MLALNSATGASLNGNSDHPDLVTSDVHLRSQANMERLGRIPLFEFILPENRLKKDRRKKKMGKITGAQV